MKFLQEHIGKKKFSDANIPLKIIATNIDTGEKVVFTEGYIVDAIRASISIPGIFAPVIFDGSHLIDG
jgi:NTE family protein